MWPVNIFTFSQLDFYTKKVSHHELLALKEKAY